MAITTKIYPKSFVLRDEMRIWYGTAIVLVLLSLYVYFFTMEVTESWKLSAIWTIGILFFAIIYLLWIELTTRNHYRKVVTK